MVPDGLTLRSINVAYLFPRQPVINRTEALAFYDRVTAAQVSVSEFAYQPTALAFRGARPGRPPNVFNVVVDHAGQQLRLHVWEDFPPHSAKVFNDQADDVWTSFGEIWDANKVGGNPVLVEVKVRVTAPVDGGDANAYLIDRITKIPHVGLQKLGRQVGGVGIRLLFPFQPGEQGGPVPLPNTQSNLSIETLLEDPSRLFIEDTVTWPMMVGMPSAVSGAPVSFMNVEVEKPSVYVDEVYNYVSGQVVDFLTTSAK